MKKVFVLGLVAITSIGFTSKPVLADCNSISYWQTSDGRCVDLTVLTQLGAIQAELSKPPVFENEEVEVTKLRLVSNSIGVDVRGTVKNISTQPVRVGMIDYEIVDFNGTPIDDGTFVTAKTINPGQTIAISDFISKKDLQGNRVSSLSVRVLSM